jgi:WD40 repeat protein
VWEVTTGKLLSILKGHSYSVRTVALNPDGRFAISGGLDNKVLFWDITTCLNQFKKEVHKSKLVNVDLSLDGRFAVSVDNGAGVKLSDVASGSVISTLSEGVGFAKHDSPGESYSAAITPDSRQCILGWSNNKIESWDLNTLKSKQFSNNRVEHISNNRVVLPINLMTGKAYDYATVSDNQIKSFSPCGRIGLLLDGTIWDIKEGKCLMNLWNLELYKSKFSPDGRFILGINTNNLASMKICDLETKDNIKTLTNRKNYQTIRDVYFSIDGRFVLSNCDDRLIRIWGVNEFWCKCISMGESSSIYLYMSPDGRKVICINNNGLKVFDLRSGILFASHEISEIDPRVASFTPNGRYYISARTDYISYNNMLQIWDMKDRKLVAMHPSNDCITTISKTISNAYLCYGTYNGCVTILALHNFFSDPPITTPVRIWQYCSSGEKGHWDKNISALCYWCGLRFQVEAEMLDVIEAVNRDNHISPNDSPCLKLPDEAWDEPKLLSECPYCHKPLRFNPFIIDNRERR